MEEQEGSRNVKTEVVKESTPAECSKKESPTRKNRKRNQTGYEHGFTSKVSKTVINAQESEENSKKDCTPKSRKRVKREKGNSKITEQSVKQKREDVGKRVQKHRAKLSEEQLEEKRRKDRERYRIKKEGGLTKGINKLINTKTTETKKERTGKLIVQSIDAK